MTEKIISRLAPRIAARFHQMPSSPNTYITAPAVSAQDRMLVYTRQPERPRMMVDTALLSMTHTSMEDSTMTSSGIPKTSADFSETAARGTSGRMRKYRNAEKMTTRAKTCRSVMPMPPMKIASLTK